MPAEAAPVGALLVVDLQRGLLTGPGAVPGAAGLVERVGAAAARARALDVPVVHLLDDGADDPRVRRGTPGGEPVVAPAPDETVLVKRGDDGFDGTGLAELLARLRVTGLALAGVQSEMCVAATARGAVARGLRVVLARDAHATWDVPPDGALAPGVPAALVARVAEWSLGDEVETPATLAEVRFRPDDRY